MRSVVRLVGLAGLIALAIVIWSGYSSGVDQPPAIITSDTSAYCQQLVTRIHDFGQANATIPPLAAKLAEDGRDRCQGGQVREGILRLRRAVMIIESGLPKN